MNMGEMGRRIHFWCFLGVVALAPLPLGANRPWSWTLLAAAIGLLCLVWPFAIWGNEDAAPISSGYVAGPIALFGSVVIWAILQMSPWAPSALADPLWGDAAAALGRPLPGRIGIDPPAGWESIMRLLSYAGAFWLALQHGRSRRHAELMVEMLAVAGGAYATYGLAIWLSGSETILGMTKWAYRGDLTSTFVNRNAYAVYAGLGLLCALAGLFRRLDGTYLSLRSVMLHLRRPTALMAIAAILVAAALPATGSRAGGTASAMAVIVLVACIFFAVRRRRNPASERSHAGLIASAFIVAFILAGVAAAMGGIADEASDRMHVYGITLQAIGEHPWTGTGLGSFPALFAMKRPFTVSQIWTEAHDTYLELTAELGLIAAAMLVAAVVWLAVLCLHGLLVRRRDWIYPALALSATFLVGAHALVDFSVQIPAVAITWTSLLGLGVAQSTRSSPQAVG